MPVGALSTASLLHDAKSRLPTFALKTFLILSDPVRKPQARRQALSLYDTVPEAVDSDQVTPNVSSIFDYPHNPLGKRSDCTQHIL